MPTQQSPTNDISTYGNTDGSANYALAEEMRAELQAAGKPNGQTWHGGVATERKLCSTRTIRSSPSTSTTPTTTPN